MAFEYIIEAAPSSAPPGKLSDSLMERLHGD
jgi:hypothetical protein